MVLEVPYFDGWLLRFADELDNALVRGLTFKQSIDLIQTQVRPRCKTCGGLIKHGGPGALFCKKNSECRKSARRLRYYKVDLGLAHDVALSIVLSRR